MKISIDEMGKSVTEDLKKTQSNPEDNKVLIETLTGLNQGLKEIMKELLQIEPNKKEILEQLDNARKQLKPNMSVDQTMDLLDENLYIKRQLREQLKMLNQCH
jgi:hypothetical protein